MEGAEVGLGGGRGGWGFAHLLVLLPRRLLALGRAVERAFAPCARFGAKAAADVALASRLEHGLNFDQLSLVVLHVLDERASGVVGAEDLLVDELLGEVLSEEGGEGAGGDVLGGEPKYVSDLLARTKFGRLSKPKRSVALILGSIKRKWVPVDYSKSKKHEGLGVYLTFSSKLEKKIRIPVFEHFTHQLVIVLVNELVTDCPRS